MGMYIYIYTHIISTWWSLKLHFHVGWSKRKFRNLIGTIQVIHMAVHFPTSIGTLCWLKKNRFRLYDHRVVPVPTIIPWLWVLKDSRLIRLRKSLPFMTFMRVSSFMKVPRLKWMIVNGTPIYGKPQMGQESGLSFEELIFIYVRSLGPDIRGINL